MGQNLAFYRARAALVGAVSQFAMKFAMKPEEIAEPRTPRAAGFSGVARAVLLSLL
jgi:hypothetical protein